jgi:dienelactone hydrolase
MAGQETAARGHEGGESKLSPAEAFDAILERRLWTLLREDHDAFRASLLVRLGETREQRADRLRAEFTRSLGLDLWANPAELKVAGLSETGAGALYGLSSENGASALLLVPPGGRLEPTPAVICLHGYGSSPEAMLGIERPGDYTRSAGLELARKGYVVLAPRLAGSAGTAVTDRARLDRLATLMGRSLIGLELCNLRSLVDWLLTRPEVDGDRIGVYGISQGGRTALFAAAIDTRIRAIACSGYFNNRWNKMVGDENLSAISAESRQDTPLPYLATREDDKFNPRAAPLWEDHVIGGLICPRPLRIEVGGLDPFVRAPDALEEARHLRELYEQAGARDQLDVEFNETAGHEMLVPGALEFFALRLGGRGRRRD